MQSIAGSIRGVGDGVSINEGMQECVGGECWHDLEGERFARHQGSNGFRACSEGTLKRKSLMSGLGKVPASCCASDVVCEVRLSARASLGESV